MEQQNGGDVAKLGESLGDGDFRNSFAEDHFQALRDAGIDEGSLPAGLIDALLRCQPEELAALAKVRGALIDEGVSLDLACRIV